MGAPIGPWHKISSEVDRASEWSTQHFCMPPGFHTVLLATSHTEDSMIYGIGGITATEIECHPEVFHPGMKLICETAATDACRLTNR